ncbi:hypothetical protein J3E69DRAFT_240164 [Trichoderma sp. SZMC 28015]
MEKKKRKRREEKKREKKVVNQKCSAMLRKRGRRGGEQEKKSVTGNRQSCSKLRRVLGLCRGDCRRLHAKASRGRTRLDHRLAGSFMPASVDRREYAGLCAHECVVAWRVSALVRSGLVCRGGNIMEWILIARRRMMQSLPLLLLQQLRRALIDFDCRSDLID